MLWRRWRRAREGGNPFIHSFMHNISVRYIRDSRGWVALWEGVAMVVMKLGPKNDSHWFSYQRFPLLCLRDCCFLFFFVFVLYLFTISVTVANS